MTASTEHAPEVKCLECGKKAAMERKDDGWKLPAKWRKWPTGLHDTDFAICEKCYKEVIIQRHIAFPVYECLSHPTDQFHDLLSENWGEVTNGMNWLVRTLYVNDPVLSKPWIDTKLDGPSFKIDGLSAETYLYQQTASIWPTWTGGGRAVYAREVWKRYQHLRFNLHERGGNLLHYRYPQPLRMRESEATPTYRIGTKHNDKTGKTYTFPVMTFHLGGQKLELALRAGKRFVKQFSTFCRLLAHYQRGEFILASGKRATVKKIKLSQYFDDLRERLNGEDAEAIFEEIRKDWPQAFENTASLQKCLDKLRPEKFETEGSNPNKVAKILKAHSTVWSFGAIMVTHKFASASQHRAALVTRDPETRNKRHVRPMVRISYSRRISVEAPPNGDRVMVLKTDPRGFLVAQVGAGDVWVVPGHALRKRLRAYERQMKAVEAVERGGEGARRIVARLNKRLERHRKRMAWLANDKKYTRDRGVRRQITSLRHEVSEHHQRWMDNWLKNRVREAFDYATRQGVTRVEYHDSERSFVRGVRTVRTESGWTQEAQFPWYRLAEMLRNIFENTPNPDTQGSAAHRIEFVYVTDPKKAQKVGKSVKHKTTKVNGKTYSDPERQEHLEKIEGIGKQARVSYRGIKMQRRKLAPARQGAMQNVTKAMQNVKQVRKNL